MCLYKVLSCLIICSVFAGQTPTLADISAQNAADPNFIRVSKEADNTILFQLCEGSAAELSADNCQQLGDRSYTPDELIKARKALRTRKNVAILSDVALVGGGVVAGALAGGVVAVGAASAAGLMGDFSLLAIIYAGTGLTIGGAAGGTGAYLVTKITALKRYLDPRYSIKRLITLDDKVILDSDVTIDKSVAEYAKTLDEVLKQI